MEKGFMDVTNYTESATSPGVYAKSTMKGNGDPGYLLTSSQSSPRSVLTRENLSADADAILHSDDGRIRARALAG